jgi:hypothetical protein
MGTPKTVVKKLGVPNTPSENLLWDSRLDPCLKVGSSNEEEYFLE